jgi:tellurite methyltransferase
MEAFYQREQHPFGTELLSLIKDWVKDFKPGLVLDLGSGDGRNALYLASLGFTVHAIDYAPTAIAQLEATTREYNLSAFVKAEVVDAADFVFAQEYDNIICTQVLHFLPTECTMTVLDQVVSHTAQGGLNIVAVFLAVPPLFNANLSQRWLKRGELQDLYATWEILSYDEPLRATKKLDKEGNHYMQPRTEIVARKI